MNTYARRRDSNHRALVAELRARGYAVSDLGSVGRGVPDLVVSRGTTMRLVEIKRPGKLLRKDGTPRKLNRNESATRARQVAWAAMHPGLVLTVSSAAEVESSWPP